MYCGDETGAFIGDVGYSSCKFGYGGEDVPKCVFPSYASYCEEPNKLGAAGIEYGPSHRPKFELAHVYEHPSSWSSNDDATSEEQYLKFNGVIANWDAYEKAWERAFVDLHVRNRTKWTSSPIGDEELGCPHPICAIEQGFTSQNSLDERNNNKQKEIIMELLFEKFNAPAVYVAPSPAVSAFSVGRPTSLVLDIGGGGCRATPMFDGLMLKTAQRRNGRGGEWLSQVQYRMLIKDVGIQVRPRYTGTVAQPFYHWNAISNVMYEMKTSSHVIVPSTRTILNSTSTETLQQDDSSYYELPDGTRVDLNKHDKFRTLPELLFVDPPHKTTNLVTTTCRNDLSIQRLVHDAVSNVDVDLRKELCGNIVLCGASSLYPGLEQRLSEELSSKLPTAAKCRVICARPIERRFAAWIGASILTSLGSFQQMWLGRAEYEESGATLAATRFQ